MRALGFPGLALGIATACGSSPPPKAVEPEPAPLEIPPLPPQSQKESAPLPRPHESPATEDDDASMAVPGPLALTCTSDAQCMTHRCNTSHGKCAFPCKTDRDCISGATCFIQGGAAMATCIPKPSP